MSEMMAFRGRLSEKRLALRQQELILRGQIDGLRTVLDPVSGPDAVDPEKFFALACDFNGRLVDFRTLKQEIMALEKAIGVRD